MGLFDSLFGSKTKTTKNPFEQNPWSWQQPFLTRGFTAGEAALENAMDRHGPGADPVADLNQRQNYGLQGMVDAGRKGMSMSDNLIDAGRNTDEQLRRHDSLNNRIWDFAKEDPTSDIINNAGQYANNPYLDQQIGSGLRDINKAFGRDQASINSAASGTGNINSTRAGALEAMALDDSMDRAADFTADMRGRAYGQGLDLASQNRSAQFGQMQTASGNHANRALMGAGMLGQGVDMRAQGAQNMFDAGAVQQGQVQNEFDGRQQHASNRLSLVDQYMKAIGGSYGKTGYTTQTSKEPGVFQQITGAITGGLGAWGDLRG